MSARESPRTRERRDLAGREKKEGIPLLVVDFVTVAALTDLHVSLPPFHLSYVTVKCFKAMSSMLFVAI